VSATTKSLKTVPLGKKHSNVEEAKEKEAVNLHKQKARKSSRVLVKTKE